MLLLYWIKSEVNITNGTEVQVGLIIIPGIVLAESLFHALFWKNQLFIRRVHNKQAE